MCYGSPWEKSNFETAVLKVSESEDNQQYLEDILLYHTLVFIISKIVTEPCNLLKSSLPGNHKEEGDSFSKQLSLAEQL